MLYHFLYAMRSQLSVLNVTRYITFRTAVAALTALFLVLALGLVPGLRRIAVVGDMLELGEAGPRLHREAGRSLAGRVDRLVGIGPLAREVVEGARAAGFAPSGLLHLPDAALAAPAVASLVAPGDAVLVKASRGIHLEQVVEALVARFGETAGETAGEAAR